MAMTPRAWFEQAGDAVLGLIGSVPADRWERPGLGAWTVRELAAHTIRAWSLVAEYLDQPVTEGDALSAGEYFAVGLTQAGAHEGVLARGRQDAASMSDPAAAARAAASTALERIAHEDGERLVPTRFGPMTLDEFLRTRAFELTVHGIDLARATGQAVPAPLAVAAVPALGLLAEVGQQRGLAVQLLLAATGREPLPEGFNLLN